MNKLSVASFTNLGFKLHQRGFQPVKADLSGRTALVTGATGGIGLEVAKQLAHLDARVIVVGRDEQKLADAGNVIDGDVRLERADLSSLSQVRTLGEDLAKSETVDILINNVGVLLPEYTTTDEGLEKSFATNLAGQFMLTNLLLPGMIGRGQGRVIIVSSGGMYTARLDPERVQMDRSNYNGTKAYAMAKRGQVVATELWAEQIEGTGVVVNAMHPGWVETSGVAFSLPTFNKIMKPLLRSVEQGADTIVWLAASEEGGRHSGRFFFDRRAVETHLSDSTVATPESRTRLMQMLERQTETRAPRAQATDS